MGFTCGFGESIGFLNIYLELSFVGATGINQSNPRAGTKKSTARI